MKKYSILKTLLLCSYLIFIIGIAFTAFSKEDGIVGRTKKGSTPGCICHGNNPASGVTVSIEGPDSVTAGSTVNYTLRVTGGPLVRGGTNIASRNGVINTTDNSLRKENGELTHTQPKNTSSGAVTFSFSYTAPGNPGTDTLFANGNSVNFDGEESGDSWNYALNKRIIIKTQTGITPLNQNPSGFSLEQNYPNPFNPKTVIQFSIAKREFTSLKVSDITGREIAVLINEILNPGSYSIDWNAYEIPSGVYLYSLTSGDRKQVKKLTLIE